jgi:hypothetical protein
MVRLRYKKRWAALCLVVLATGIDAVLGYEQLYSNSLDTSENGKGSVFGKQQAHSTLYGYKSTSPKVHSGGVATREADTSRPTSQPTSSPTRESDTSRPTSQPTSCPTREDRGMDYTGEVSFSSSIHRLYTLYLATVL